MARLAKRLDAHRVDRRTKAETCQSAPWLLVRLLETHLRERGVGKAFAPVRHWEPSRTTSRFDGLSRKHSACSGSCLCPRSASSTPRTASSKAGPLRGTLVLDAWLCSRRSAPLCGRLLAPDACKNGRQFCSFGFGCGASPYPAARHPRADHRWLLAAADARCVRLTTSTARDCAVFACVQKQWGLFPCASLHDFCASARCRKRSARTAMATAFTHKRPLQHFHGYHELSLRLPYSAPCLVDVLVCYCSPCSEAWFCLRSTV